MNDGALGEGIKIRKVARSGAFARARVRSAISGRRLPSAHYYFQAHKAPLDGFSISEEGDGARSLVFILFFIEILRVVDAGIIVGRWVRAIKTYDVGRRLGGAQRLTVCRSVPAKMKEARRSEQLMAAECCSSLCVVPHRGV